MSRIGKKPIPVPSGVTVSLSGDTVQVKGPKGTLSRSVVDGVSVDVQTDVVLVSRADDSAQCRANHGLMRALLNNMVIGVSKGFTKELEIIGVGYKAEVKGNKVVFNLGYSHQIVFPFPEGIKISVEKNTSLAVTGSSKEAVGQAAAEIRGFRPPDSYKGKGVRYKGEHIRIKAGKTAQ
jgi:large subunit ribosomal protein L6